MKKFILLPLAILMASCVQNELIGVYEEPTMPEPIEVTDSVSNRSNPDDDPWNEPPGTPISFSITVSDYDETTLDYDINI